MKTIPCKIERISTPSLVGRYGQHGSIVLVGGGKYYDGSILGRTVEEAQVYIGQMNTRRVAIGLPQLAPDFDGYLAAVSRRCKKNRRVVKCRAKKMEAASMAA